MELKGLELLLLASAVWNKNFFFYFIIWNQLALVMHHSWQFVFFHAAGGLLNFNFVFVLKLATQLLPFKKDLFFGLFISLCFAEVVLILFFILLLLFNYLNLWVLWVLFTFHYFLINLLLNVFHIEHFYILFLAAWFATTSTSN